VARPRRGGCSRRPDRRSHRRPPAGNRRYQPINKLDPALEAKLNSRWREYGIGVPYLDEDQREMLTMVELAKKLPEV
jgi:hypothetical protein